MRVALVYDRINKIGGAEQVLSCFHELYPLADWYTSVWDPAKAPFSQDWQVSPSFLNRIPFFRHHHELIPYLMPFAFESFDLTGYDLVISVGSAEAKGVITRPGTLHLHYCLTPTRYLYSHQAQYLSNSFFRLVAKSLRAWDQVACTRPDVMISISEHVKKRVRKYYDRDSVVIYPPVHTERFVHSGVNGYTDIQIHDYFLVVSRLVPYKNIDLIVRVFNQNGKKLIIVGQGSERSKLKRIAQANIRLVGQVSEKELIKYYAGCRAFVQANIEDFGIAMVEALASGKPVIAYKEGGAGEIVTSGTGVLYNELSVGALNDAIRELESRKFSPSLCRQKAAVFDSGLWKKAIKERIMTEWDKHKKIYG